MLQVNPPRPRPPIFVGLPLDVVSDLNIVNHDKAIEAGLCALSLLGVHGVDLPISWGIATDNGWSSYLAIAAMARDAGLRLRVSLNLHGHEHPNLPLPKYVSRAAHSDPDIFFTDLSSNRYHDCLSFSVDDLPVLGGRTPMEVYEEFFHNFRHAFSDFFDSTITVREHAFLITFFRSMVKMTLNLTGHNCWPWTQWRTSIPFFPATEQQPTNHWCRRVPMLR